MIRDVYDLQAMGAKAASLNKAYKLNNDIVAGVTQTNSWNSGAGFNPVGNATNKFTGSLDGDGYQIQSLFINRGATDYIGLFGYIDTSGSVSNLGMTSVNITGKVRTAAVAAKIDNSSSITNSYSTGTVSSTASIIGGLVGAANGGASISNSYSTATVSATTTDAGGLVGAAWSASALSISKSYATGNISGTTEIGGLVGSVGGGLASISNSYATGNVNGTQQVGGLVGRGGYFGATAITNSYASGIVTATSNKGGFLGFNDAGTPSVQTNCFWLKYSGHNDSLNGVGSGSGTGVTNKNYLEMVRESTYTGWDFDNNWWINEEAGLPFLRHQGYVWNGSASSIWTNRLNWDKKRGYPGDGGDGADKWVFINTGSQSISTPGSAITLGGLQLGPSYSGTVTLGNNLTLNHDGNNNGLLEINAGTLSQSTRTLTTGGVNMTGGTLNGNSGTTTIKGNVNISGSGTKLNTTSGTMTAININISSSGEVEMATNGTLKLSGSGTPLTGNGTLDTTTNTPNTIEYTGSGTTSITAVGPATTYSNLSLKPKGFSREDMITLDTTGQTGVNGEVLDTANGYAYIPTFDYGSATALIVKVRLSDFKQVGILNLASGDTRINAGLLDSENGKIYFGADTSPGRVIKIDIATFSRDGALDFAGPNEDKITCAGVIDTSGATNYAYFGVMGTPAVGKGNKVVRVNLNTFTQDGSIEPANTNYVEPHSASIDTINGFAYFDSTDPGNNTTYLHQIDLSLFGSGWDTATESITVSASANALHNQIIDTTNNFLYTASYTSPAVIYKIDTNPSNTFEVESSLTLNTGENLITSSSLDRGNEMAYFVTGQGGATVKVIKVNIDAPTFSRVTSITMNGGETGEVNTSLLDEDKGTMYIATFQEPSKMIKINLGNDSMKLGTAGSQTIDVNGNMVVGDGTNPANVTATDYNPAVDTEGSFTISSGGLFTASDSGAFNVGGNWSNSGTFTHNSGTVTFDGADPQTVTTGGQTFNNIILNNTGTVTTADDDVIISGNLDINGNLTITAGDLNLSTNNPNVNTAGNVSIAGYVTKGTGTWTFDGTTATTYSEPNVVSQNIGDVVIAKTDGNPDNNKVTLSVSANNNLFVDTLNISANNTLDLNDQGYVLGILNNGATDTVLTVNGTLDTGVSTVMYSALNSGGNIKVAQIPYNTLNVAGDGETHELTGHMTGANKITGDLIVGSLSDSFLDATTNSYNVELEGNLYITGNFNTRSNTVSLINSSQTSSITNSNVAPPSYAVTFNNLSVSSGKTVKFESGKYFKVNGELSLNGTSVSKVTIDSTTGLGQWYINHQGTESVDYVNLSNSGCVAGSSNISLLNSTDVVNNGSCWVFISPVIPPIPNNNSSNIGTISVKKTVYNPYGYYTESSAVTPENPEEKKDTEDNKSKKTYQDYEKSVKDEAKSVVEKVIGVMFKPAGVTVSFIFLILIFILFFFKKKLKDDKE